MYFQQGWAIYCIQLSHILCQHSQITQDRWSNIQFLLRKLPLHDRVEGVMTGGLISVQDLSRGTADFISMQLLSGGQGGSPGRSLMVAYGFSLFRELLLTATHESFNSATTTASQTQRRYIEEHIEEEYLGDFYLCCSAFQEWHYSCNFDRCQKPLQTQ